MLIKFKTRFLMSCYYNIANISKIIRFDNLIKAKSYNSYSFQHDNVQILKISICSILIYIHLKFKLQYGSIIERNLIQDFSSFY